MTNHQIASNAIIACCIALAAYTNSIGAFMALTTGICLYGFILWLDRNKVDGLKDLEIKITALKERVDIQSFRNK